MGGRLDDNGPVFVCRQPLQLPHKAVAAVAADAEQIAEVLALDSD
jgi:hypothetical protein